MEKISKIILITLLIGIFCIACTNVYAVTPTDYRPGDPTDYEDFFDKAGVILGFVRNLGAIASVLGIAVLGIRYMLGSIDEKAKYKETMLPFIIAIFITVGMTTIITIVQEIAKDI